MSNERVDRHNSAAPRHEQGLSWISWLLEMETWYGDIRRTLRVATQLGQQRRKKGYVNPSRNMMSD